ncbi:MAG: Hsp20/alpha crystallin family protein [Ignavibacteria bacterium]|nr:Hsp20/alpha crystallin family protein [Ignavibacteria bacterium]
MQKNESKDMMKIGNRALATTPAVRFISPPVDIYEDNEAFHVIVEMPGVTKDSLSLTVESHRLSIKGMVVTEPADSGNPILQEIPDRNYYRAFNLSDGIDSKNIEATLEDGVLTITLRKNEKLQSKEIRVK